ncbi:MAG: O-antigen ligase family protein [Deltaproteobacteria bacterium]|nr:O-antigen ligase family protein [Deltaproteobacteria bacterium]
MSVAASPTLSGGRVLRPATSAGALWSLVALVALGALLGFATVLGYEATALGLIVVGAVLATVVVHPAIGVLMLIANFLVASYPSPIRGEGLLTINNILGIILVVLMVAELAQRPNLWFLRVRQLHVFLAIGVVFIISTVVSAHNFPNLRVTSGKWRLLDQTIPMAQDFITRLAFFILTLQFLARKRDLKRAITVMMMCLIMVVPSALLGYASGGGESGGYRAAAEFSVGTNSNRLAFLCLIQIAFWWYFMRTDRSLGRTALAAGVIASLIFTIFLTASRSGVIGLGILFYMLTKTRGRVRGGRLQVVAVALVAIGVLLTVIPEENLERIENINPFATGTHDQGSHSTERRIDTIELGWRIFQDYPSFGIGLGNFREIAQQVYFDPFLRPPHNSYVWSLSEGGIFCLLFYLLLFWYTWRDVQWLQASPAVPKDLGWIVAALPPCLVMLLFFSAFADIWLSPITYILIGLVVALRRYVSCRRVVLV